MWFTIFVQCAHIFTEKLHEQITNWKSPFVFENGWQWRGILPKTILPKNTWWSLRARFGSTPWWTFSCFPSPFSRREENNNQDRNESFYYCQDDREWDRFRISNNDLSTLWFRSRRRQWSTQRSEGKYTRQYLWRNQYFVRLRSRNLWQPNDLSQHRQYILFTKKARHDSWDPKCHSVVYATTCTLSSRRSSSDSKSSRGLSRSSAAPATWPPPWWPLPVESEIPTQDSSWIRYFPNAPKMASS